MDVGLEFVRDYDACPKRIRRQVYRLGKDLADGLDPPPLNWSTPYH